MLKIIYSMSQLKFSDLMTVYYEANCENGAEKYPILSKDAQVREAEYDFYQYLNEVFFKTQNAYYAIWEEGNRYITALRVEPYNDGVLFSALETLPSVRRKGYASTLIQSVQEYLRHLGEIPIYSHVSKGNVASMATHLKCNFRILLDYAVYLDGSVLHNSYTLFYDYKKGET